MCVDNDNNEEVTKPHFQLLGTVMEQILRYIEYVTIIGNERI